MLLDPETLALAVRRRAAARPARAEDRALLVPRGDEHERLRDGATRRSRSSCACARWLAAAHSAAGLAVAATGAHPFSQPEEQEIVQEPRYLAMLAERPAARRQLVCGLHVHVGMESFEQCLATLEAVLPWLPAVLALSVNSPYLDGAEPGVLSGRAGRLLELPRAGAPPVLDTVGERGSRSSRPRAATTRGSGGTCGRIHASARSRCGSPTSRRASRVRPRSPRSSRRSASPRRAPAAAAVPRRSTSSSVRARARRSRRQTSCSSSSSRRHRELGSWELVPSFAADRGATAARGRRARRAEGGRGGRPRSLRRLGSQRVLRAVLYPLRLAAARLGRRSGPALLVVIGIAAGAAVVFGGRTVTTVAQDRAVAQAIERIPDGSRSVRAVWFGLPGIGDEPQPALERERAAALAGAGAGSATSLVLFRETTIAGSFAGLGGVEQLGRWVTLRSGRLPRVCTPGALRGAAAPRRGQAAAAGGAAARRGGHGRARQPDPVRATSSRRPTTRSRTPRSARPWPPPRPATTGRRHLRSSSAKGVARLAAVARARHRIYRSYAWVSPLAPGRPRLWEIDRLAAGVTRARSELQAVSTSFDLIAPVEELRAAQIGEPAAGRRLGLVAGEAAALLFAFAILAALTLRRDLVAARRRLAWFGARGWQLALLTAAETGPALAGTAIGFGVGVRGGGAPSRGRQARRPGAVLEQSILSRTRARLAVLVAVLPGPCSREPSPSGAAVRPCALSRRSTPRRRRARARRVRPDPRRCQRRPRPAAARARRPSPRR